MEETDGPTADNIVVSEPAACVLQYVSPFTGVKIQVFTGPEKSFLGCEAHSFIRVLTPEEDYENKRRYIFQRRLDLELCRQPAANPKKLKKHLKKWFGVK